LGKSQRTKGAVYEREVCDTFNSALGTQYKRNIGQARDGGNDIDAGGLTVECKRRATLTTVENWYKQAAVAVDERFDREGATTIPLVVARADQGTSFAILDLDDFLRIWKYAAENPLGNLDITL
jgi:hypothetical protein